MKGKVAPRIYCIPATEARVVAVFRRGPTQRYLDARLLLHQGWWPLRRRGWEETPDCPPRDPKDIWDQRRNARMQKRQPGGNLLLCVESRGWAGGEFGIDQAVDGMSVLYSLESDGNLEVLDELQWADWDRKGQLLVATRCGKLQVWNLDANGRETLFEEDLSRLEPNPTPAPAWANRW